MWLLAKVFPARVPTSDVGSRILVKLLMFRGLPQIDALATVEDLLGDLGQIYVTAVLPRDI